LSGFTEQNAGYQNTSLGAIGFLNLPTKGAKRIFIRALQKYCEALNMSPDELIALRIEGL